MVQDTSLSCSPCRNRRCMWRSTLITEHAPGGWRQPGPGLRAPEVAQQTARLWLNMLMSVRSLESL